MIDEHDPDCHLLLRHLAGLPANSADRLVAQSLAGRSLAAVAVAFSSLTTITRKVAQHRAAGMSGDSAANYLDRVDLECDHLEAAAGVMVSQLAALGRLAGVDAWRDLDTPLVVVLAGMLRRARDGEDFDG